MRKILLLFMVCILIASISIGIVNAQNVGGGDLSGSCGGLLCGKAALENAINLTEKCAENSANAAAAVSQACAEANAIPGSSYNFIPGDVPAQMCFLSETPLKVAATNSAGLAAHGGSRAEVFSSGCPCPGGVKVKKDGCRVTFTCDMGGSDSGESVSATIPCPKVAGTDPQYPLVKMLSGTLIEWSKPGTTTTTHTVSYGAPEGIGVVAGYGAQVYDINFDITLSSVDIGQNVNFSVSRANAQRNKNSSSVLEHSNLKYYLVGDNDYVEVLSQKDIYDAYKDRSKYVQAYLALENKHYGERPWNTYEKFIKGMCNMSSDYGRCLDELLVVGHKDTEMDGNVYYGNANFSVLGVYSEVSSHKCHGAATMNDKNQPAFAIEIESHWCFYIKATYASYIYVLKQSSGVGGCCVKWHVEVKCTDAGEDASGDSSAYYGSHGGKRKQDCVVSIKCDQRKSYWLQMEGWTSGGSGQSSGGCGVCVDTKGYVDEFGEMHTDPLPISFYQSQPLLVKPAD